MSKVILYMSMSVDGFIAAPGDEMGHGLGVGGEPLHAWLADGGISPGSCRPTSRVNAEVFDEMMATGAVITGRRTFEFAGQWGGDHHDGVPIFVLTRTPPRAARVRACPLRDRPRSRCRRSEMGRGRSRRHGARRLCRASSAPRGAHRRDGHSPRPAAPRSGQTTLRRPGRRDARSRAGLVACG